MAKKKLKVAVTGLGVSWEAYLKCWAEAPETELTLLHDANPEWAQKVSQEYGGIAWTADYKDVLASGVDIVDVSTPNHFHAEQTVAALEAGKHVLCQKPMAPSVADCRRMVNAARRTGRTLGIFMCRLGEAVFADVRKMAQEKLFGKVAAVRIRSAHRGALLSPGPWGWRHKRDNVGGGSFMQLSVHSLNFVEYALDDTVVSVMGYAKNLYSRHSIEGEDAVSAAGEMKSGALITMESGYSSLGDAVEIYGTEGTAIITGGQVTLEFARDFDGCVLSYRRGKEEFAPMIRVDLAPFQAKMAAAYKKSNQNRAFARAILEGRPAPVPGEAGMRDVAIAQAIYRSAETGKRVSVDDLLRE